MYSMIHETVKNKKRTRHVSTATDYNTNKSIVNNKTSVISPAEENETIGGKNPFSSPFKVHKVNYLIKYNLKIF